jgi:glycosyltransferase involved in cell wall biosynthesis
MALGLPIIATNICSLPELIEDGKEGILVEPNNKEQFLNAILKVLKDENFRNEIIKNAKQKSQIFSIKNTLDKLEKLLMK